MGLTGEPVPPLIRSGAIVSRKSLRPSSGVDDEPVLWSIRAFRHGDRVSGSCLSGPSWASIGETLVQLNRFDLNLLVAPDALLREKSVTRAAERVYMSQPAMSSALGRLRGGMTLSARARPPLGTSSRRPRSGDRGLQSHLYLGVAEIQFMIYRSSASRPADAGTAGATATRKPVSSQAR